jgi:hypothetical protein
MACLLDELDQSGSSFSAVHCESHVSDVRCDPSDGAGSGVTHGTRVLARAGGGGGERPCSQVRVGVERAADYRSVGASGRGARVAAACAMFGTRTHTHTHTHPVGRSPIPVDVVDGALLCVRTGVPVTMTSTDDTWRPPPKRLPSFDWHDRPNDHLAMNRMHENDWMCAPSPHTHAYPLLCVSTAVVQVRGVQAMFRWNRLGIRPRPTVQYAAVQYAASSDGGLNVG